VARIHSLVNDDLVELAWVGLSSWHDQNLNVVAHQQA
jgi:hypothetical protein